MLKMEGRKKNRNEGKIAKRDIRNQIRKEMREGKKAEENIQREKAEREDEKERRVERNGKVQQINEECYEILIHIYEGLLKKISAQPRSPSQNTF